MAVRWYRATGCPTGISKSSSPSVVSRSTTSPCFGVQRFTPLLIDAARPVRHLAGDRWFVDETYVKVDGFWPYVYRAVDQHGQVIDVFVSVVATPPPRVSSSPLR